MDKVWDILDTKIFWIFMILFGGFFAVTGYVTGSVTLFTIGIIGTPVSTYFYGFLDAQ